MDLRSKSKVARLSLSPYTGDKGNKNQSSAKPQVSTSLLPNPALPRSAGLQSSLPHKHLTRTQLPFFHIRHTCCLMLYKTHSATKQQQETKPSTFVRAEGAIGKATCKLLCCSKLSGKGICLWGKGITSWFLQDCEQGCCNQAHMNALWAALQAHTGDSGFQMWLWSCKLLWGSGTDTALVVESRLPKGKQRQPSACRVGTERQRTP